MNESSVAEQTAMGKPLEAADFECIYCGTPCELSDAEPYCSDECAREAAREDEAEL